MKVIIYKEKTKNKLGEIKERYALSTKELSEKTGIFYNKMCQLVGGKKIPSLCDLIKICNTFNKKISEILDYRIVDN